MLDSNLLRNFNISILIHDNQSGQCDCFAIPLRHKKPGSSLQQSFMQAGTQLSSQLPGNLQTTQLMRFLLLESELQ